MRTIKLHVFVNYQYKSHRYSAVCISYAILNLLFAVYPICWLNYRYELAYLREDTRYFLFHLMFYKSVTCVIWIICLKGTYIVTAKYAYAFDEYAFLR